LIIKVTMFANVYTGKKLRKSNFSSGLRVENERNFIDHSNLCRAKYERDKPWQKKNNIQEESSLLDELIDY